MVVTKDELHAFFENARAVPPAEISGKRKHKYTIRWTEDKESELTRLKAEGKSTEEIAEHFGTNKKAIINHWCQMNARKSSLVPAGPEDAPPEPEAAPASEQKPGAPSPVPEAAPAPKPEAPQEAPEEEPAITRDSVVYRALRLAMDEATPEYMETHWRQMIERIEETVNEVYGVILRHPNTEWHYANIAAVIALDEVAP